MTAPYHLLFPYVPSPVAHCRVEGYWETLWSTGCISLPFPPAPCHFAGFGDEREGRAELEHRKHKQMDVHLLAASQPMPTRWVLVRGWVAGKRSPLYQSIYASRPPLCNPGTPLPPVLPTPVAGLHAQKAPRYDAAWQWVICPNL